MTTQAQTSAIFALRTLPTFFRGITSPSQSLTMFSLSFEATFASKASMNARGEGQIFWSERRERCAQGRTRRLFSQPLEKTEVGARLEDFGTDNVHLFPRIELLQALGHPCEIPDGVIKLRGLLDKDVTDDLHRSYGTLHSLAILLAAFS